MTPKPFHGPRFLLAVLVVFGFVFLYEWALHGWLLADEYARSAALWRPPETIADHLAWLIAGYLIFVVFFGLIYLRFRRTGRMAEGALYGLLVGLLLCGVNLIFYAVQPLPLSLVIYWCLGVLAEGLLAGLLMAAVYKDRELYA